jgi:FkbM family methyltransferase
MELLKRPTIPNLLRLIRVRTVQRRLMTGQSIRLRTDSVLTNSIWKERSFEPAVRAAILSRCKPGMTVVDAGANFGYYTLQIATLVGPGGRVLAAEPNPTMVRELESNLRLNGITNVTVAQVALSDENGTAEFCFPEDGREAHGSLRPNATFRTASRRPVLTAKLNTCLEGLGLSTVGLIKIDVEGAELAVLRGADRVLATMKPVLVFEAAEHLSRAFGNTVFDTLLYLHGFGYKMTELAYGNWLAQ